MRLDLRISAAAGVLMFSLAVPANAGGSAVIDMTRQSGPSRFVTGSDGRPAQLGRLDPNARVGEPGVVTIVPGPQLVSQPKSDAASSGQTSGEQGQDAEKKAGLDPNSTSEDAQDSENSESIDRENPENEAPDDESSDKNPDDVALSGQPDAGGTKMPEAGATCDPDCDGD